MGWSKLGPKTIFRATADGIWKILFWGTLVGMIAMIINIAVLPTVYRSESTIYVSDAAAGVQPSTVSQAGSAVVEQSFADSYTAVMKSETALSMLKESLESKMSLDALSKTYTIGQVGQSAIFKITVRYSDPQSAQLLSQNAAESAVKALESVGVSAYVLDGGNLPNYPESPAALRSTLIALAAGLVVRWVLVMISALRCRVLRSRTEWEQTFDIPVLAEIPERGV